ncbi:MAG: hypothetical protein AAFR84_21380 [Pseudomonadota bacterium]
MSGNVSRLTTEGAAAARDVRWLVPVVAASLLTGCIITPGASTLDGELSRLRGGSGFAVVAVSPQEAVIDARGRTVVVNPGPGACINPDTLDLAENAAFMLLTDCAVELGATTGTASATPAGERLHLEHGFPGLTTVSVSGDPRGTLESLERFIASDAGKVRLARGSDGAGVEVKEMREIGDALFVLARSLEPTMPLLSDEFWRAFIELNDRLVLVTVSAFQANALGKEEMFDEALAHVQALQAGNNGVLALAPSGLRTTEVVPVRALETKASEVAETSDATPAPKPEPDAEPETATPAEALPQIKPVRRTGAEGDGPVPPKRPIADARTPVDAGPQAPERAPSAPRRSGT